MKQATWRPARYLAALTLIFWAAPAYAYLDPGTASLVLQGIVGAIGAGIVAIGIYWRKFVGLFRRTAPDEAKNESLDQPDTYKGNQGN